MILLVYNTKKHNSLKALKLVTQVLNKEKYPYKTISHFPFKKSDRKTMNQATSLITIGGDGTILNALSCTETHRLPILPIHSGTLGFISSIKISHIKKLLTSYIKYLKTHKKSGFKIEKRFLIEVTFNGKKQYAFNDAVISKGNYPKLINIETSINHIKTVSFRADGLILATATGSTAYNLASGGPILHPSIPAMIFNPICPHSLTLKPIVIPGEDSIEVKASLSESKAPVYLVLDGLSPQKVTADVKVKFKLSDKFIEFIKPLDEHYYSVLKEKMHWGI